MIGGCDNIHTQHLIITIVIIANIMQYMSPFWLPQRVVSVSVWLECIFVRLLPCYLVPSSCVRLLVITTIIFLNAFRSLAEPPSSVNVQIVAALLSPRQRARQMVRGQTSSMSTLRNVGWLALDSFPLPCIQAVTLIICKCTWFATWLVYHSSLH